MALANYQIAVPALTVGDSTVYDVAKEQGFSEYSTLGFTGASKHMANDDYFPLQWGTVRGTDEVDPRYIVLELEMLNDPVTLQSFRNAFLPGGDIAMRAMFPEFPEEMTIQVRVRECTRVRTLDDVFGVVKVVLHLNAADPRLYSSASYQMGIPVFTVGGDSLDLTLGAGADLGFDLTLGAGANLGFDFTGLTATGLVVCTNAGNVDTYPSMLFIPDAGGAMTGWTVTNLTTGEIATFSTRLNPGSTMVADFAVQATSKTGAPITINGAAAYPAWQQPRTPLRLAPGANTLRFDVTGGTAGGSTCLVSWANAWL